MNPGHTSGVVHRGIRGQIELWYARVRNVSTFGPEKEWCRHEQEPAAQRVSFCRGLFWFECKRGCGSVSQRRGIRIKRSEFATENVSGDTGAAAMAKKSVRGRQCGTACYQPADGSVGPRNELSWRPVQSAGLCQWNVCWSAGECGTVSIRKLSDGNATGSLCEWAVLSGTGCSSDSGGRQLCERSVSSQSPRATGGAESGE